MNAGYVKFLRGTQAAYDNLAVKNLDTLYFVVKNKGDKFGSLYIGDILISSGTSAFSGIDLENIEEDAILYYQVPTSETEEGKWIAKPISEINTKSNIHIFETSIQKDTSHSEAITEATKLATVIAGDICIVKENIDTRGHQQYTAYVYNGTVWKAMDGNYNAENVYFDEDLVTTKEIGNITLTNGSATISAEGKNLKEVWDTIFIKQKNPIVTDPFISLSFNGGDDSGEYEYEVGSVVIPTYSVEFSGGNYQFGPETGVEMTSVSVILNETSEGITMDSDTLEGNFGEFTIYDNTNISISAYASHTSGTIPYDNLKDPVPSLKINAGNTAEKQSAAITGYRKTFFGTTTTRDATITSNIVRNLSGSVNSSKVESFEVSIPLGAKRTIIALPGNVTLKSIQDENNSYGDILNSFFRITKTVNDVSGHNPMSYTIYYINYNGSLTKANTYIVNL